MTHASLINASHAASVLHGAQQLDGADPASYGESGL